MVRPNVDDYFGDWKQREALVQEMIPVIGQLFSQRNVGIFIYGRPLHNRSVTFIMKSHRFVRQIERNEMSEFERICVFGLRGEFLRPEAEST